MCQYSLKKGGDSLKKRDLAPLLLTLAFCLVLLFYPRRNFSLGSFSLDFFSRLFESKEAREVFDLDEEEAVAVFGGEDEAVFL